MPRPGGKKVFAYGLRGQGVTRKARNALGQFTSMQVEIKIAHRKMAEQVQQDVVEAFEQSLLQVERVQKRQRYLHKALASPKAVKYNLDGFVYLPAGYLDRSAARRYWRLIEDGTSIFVGRELRGFFRSLEGKTSSPSASRQGADPYMPQMKKKPSKKKIAAAKSGKFVKGIGHPITIRNPILAHNYIEHGVAAFEASGFIEETYNEAFSRFAGYKKVRGGSGSLRAVRD